MRQGHVYKYKPLTQNPEHAFEIIRDSQLFFPSPSQLNDPEEAKPEQYIGDIHDAKYWPKVEKWVRQCISYRAVPPSEHAIQSELKALTQQKLNQMTAESSKQYKQAIEQRYRILSFATTPANRHLWEEYAGKFDGVSFEFRTDSSFGTCYYVCYSDEPRMFDITSDDDYEHLIQTGLIKKTRWKPEGEVRMIFGEPPIDSSQPVLVNQRYNFQSRYLTRLFIGHRVSSQHKNEIIALAKAHEHKIRCYQVWPLPWSQRVLILPIF